MPLHLSLRNAIGAPLASRGLYTSFPASTFLESLFDANLSDYNSRYELAETDDGDFVLTLPLPGFKRDDITIEVDHRTLTVSAKNAKASFARSLDLLETIDAARISATLEDGLLTLTLGRHEVTKPRKIAIK